jgi:hypothetical protein
MPSCPKGHESVAADYCDECGTPIGAPRTPAASAAPAAPVVTGDPCPVCATPRTGRFCEVCGHDFLAEAAGSPAQAGSAGSPAQAGSAGSPAQDGGAGSAPGATAAPRAGAAVREPLPQRAGPASGWRVVVVADREYHARMLAAAMPEAEPIAFPVFCPERRFVLEGGQLLIGRRSRSRGIEPDIDLTGPPEDPAVSHAHALLVASQDGGWTVVDLDSANGTYLNDGTDPIEANVPVPVKDGDRIHVGAWTTMTLQAG